MPSKRDSDEGNSAPCQWKAASQKERNRLAAKLVLGRALDGLTRQELIMALGEPDGPPERQDPTYSVLDQESQCHLTVVFKDHKVVDSYLDVND